MKILLALIACCLLAACQSTPTPNVPSKPPIPPDLKITLERGLCRGTCPAYTVTVYSNGQVVFGEEKPGTLRNTPFIVSQEQLQQLVKAIETNDFFALEVNQYSYVKDVSSATITIVMNGQSRRIWHYGYSCNTSESDAPQELCDLEDLIDEVTGAKWLQGRLVPTATLRPTSPPNEKGVTTSPRLEHPVGEALEGVYHVGWESLDRTYDIGTLKLADGLYSFTPLIPIEQIPRAAIDRLFFVKSPKGLYSLKYQDSINENTLLEELNDFTFLVLIQFSVPSSPTGETLNSNGVFFIANEQESKSLLFHSFYSEFQRWSVGKAWD